MLLVGKKTTSYLKYVSVTFQKTSPCRSIRVFPSFLLFKIGPPGLKQNCILRLLKKLVHDLTCTSLPFEGAAEEQECDIARCVEFFLAKTDFSLGIPDMMSASEGGRGSGKSRCS